MGTFGVHEGTSWKSKVDQEVGFFQEAQGELRERGEIKEFTERKGMCVCGGGAFLESNVGDTPPRRNGGVSEDTEPWGDLGGLGFSMRPRTSRPHLFPNPASLPSSADPLRRKPSQS